MSGLAWLISLPQISQGQNQSVAWLVSYWDALEKITFCADSEGEQNAVPWGCTGFLAGSELEATLSLLSLWSEKSLEAFSILYL